MSLRPSLLLPTATALLTLLAACDGGKVELDDTGPGETGGDNGGGDNGGDNGGDSSGDNGGDTSGDNGGDTGDWGGEDPAVDPVLDAAHGLVLGNSAGFDVYDMNGDSIARWELSDLTGGDCSGQECLAEGAHGYDGGLYFTWSAMAGRSNSGGLISMVPGGDDLQMDWEVRDFIYPHDAVHDPTGPYVIVCDVIQERTLWIADDGSETGADGAAVIDDQTPGFNDFYHPNGFDELTVDGKHYLVMSNRGNNERDPSDEHGNVTLWDISDRTNPRFVWQFPASGHVMAPHDPSIHYRDGHWMLLFAHSHGYHEENGSISISFMDELESQPQYVADLLPPTGHWTFPRGAELAGDDTLYITDSGGPGSPGYVYETALPTGLSASGKTGESSTDGSDQSFVTLDDISTLVTGADVAFSAFIWELSF